MPNHIRNRLTFEGEQSKIDELKAKFSTHYPETQATSFDGDLTFEKDGGYGWLAKDGTFKFRQEGGEIVQVDKMADGYTPWMEEAWTRFPDFGKVIEMPESLASTTSDGLIMFIENPFSQRDIISNFVKAIQSHDLESVENLAKGIVNLKKYGHATWYNWSIENWGTKWNSYDCEAKGDNVFEFDTAWNGVPKLIFAIAQAFPEVKITYEYSDEDTSSNCGIYVFEGGFQAKDKIFENGSKEAYEHAFKLRPEYAENYVLVDGNYQYKEDSEEEKETEAV